MHRVVAAIMMRAANVFAALSAACGVAATGLLWLMGSGVVSSGRWMLAFGCVLTVGFLAGCVGFAMASARPVSGALGGLAIGCAGAVFGALTARYVLSIFVAAVGAHATRRLRATSFLALPLAAAAAFLEYEMMSSEGPIHALSAFLACIGLAAALAPGETRPQGTRLLAAGGLFLCGALLGVLGIALGSLG